MASRAGIAYWKPALATLAIFSAPLFPADRPDDPVNRAMKDELVRSMAQLQLPQMEKPYFVAYRIQDVTHFGVSASLGSVDSSAGPATRARTISVEMRVGDYALDNTNFFSMQAIEGGMFFSGRGEAALDDDYAQIRRELWLASDTHYKQALENLSAKRAALKARTSDENIPDFSKEAPVALNEAHPIAAADEAKLKAMARELSAVFRSVPEINSSGVEIKYSGVQTRYLNSEGTSFGRSDRLIKLEVHAETQAPNGLPISDSFAVYARSAADLPSREVLLERVQKMSGLVLKLRSSSTIDRYNGPVLFEGAAAGEIFLQQFGSRLASSRTPLSDNPQFEMMFSQIFDRLGGPPLQDKIGARVLPSFLSVQDNPSLNDFRGTPLLGTSTIDDDGVRTRETTLVDHGVLKTLLSTRVPVRGILQSTGSRRGPGAAPSNLILNSTKTMPAGELRQELLRLAKERGLDYALVVRRVGAGSAASFLDLARQMSTGQGTSRSLSEVYKLYPDGHEELIRGVHITELPAESFKEIAATGDAPVVYSDEVMPRLTSMFFTGFSGGENLPVVSCVSPALLFEEVSVAKTEGPFPALPISPSPLAEK